MNLSRIDLNLLSVFAVIAQTRSVTLAADQLALSQPAVSHALARLRRTMDDPLFIRGKDGFILTTRAEALVPPVLKLLADATLLLKPPQFDPATTDKTFHICVSDYTVATLIPKLVREFRADAPLAKIELYSPNDETLVSYLELGKIELAFGPSNIIPKAPFLQTHLLFNEYYIGVIHNKHPLVPIIQAGKLTLESYLAYPHLQMSFRNHALTAVEEALIKLQRTRNVFMVVPGFVNNLALLVDTDLIMSLPSRMMGTFGNVFDLISFELPFEHKNDQYSMIWHNRTTHDPAMIWLRNIITKISIDILETS
ncbi:transcriptional regulator [Gammaproteobacteria bacterium]|nr:transcriptional regulator [Gammaproteobacteria bacterium]